MDSTVRYHYTDTFSLEHRGFVFFQGSKIDFNISFHLMEIMVISIEFLISFSEGQILGYYCSFPNHFIAYVSGFEIFFITLYTIWSCFLPREKRVIVPIFSFCWRLIKQFILLWSELLFYFVLVKYDYQSCVSVPFLTTALVLFFTSQVKISCFVFRTWSRHSKAFYG